MQSKNTGITASLALEGYLKHIEGGPYLKVYTHISKDPTIGFGHKWKIGDKTVITAEEAEAYFHQDLQIAVNAVKDLVVWPLNYQCQVDALISGLFNLGAGSINGTHFLTFLNHGQFVEAFSIWSQFCHAKGEAIEGLLTRRIDETRIFFGRRVDGYSP